MAVSVASVREQSGENAASELTRERILRAAEDLLRRHGADKARVVDIARVLGMSHGNVYRHFESKDEIQQLVTQRWLTGISLPMAEIADRPGPAVYRLHAWANKLIALKQDKFRNDPELFANYHWLATDSRGVIDQHVEELQRQIRLILADGIEQGEFKIDNAHVAASAIYDATSRFHHPYFVQHQPAPDERVKPVLDMLIAGLKAGVI